MTQQGTLKQTNSISISFPYEFRDPPGGLTDGGQLLSFTPGATSLESVDLLSGTTKKTLLPAPAEGSRLTVSDINNDGRGDLLFHGKETSGIQMFPGAKGGGYVPAKTLFPDISVADIETTDLNGDLIADLFVVDWLSNRVVFYSGIGRGVFSEQIALEVPAEPADIALSREKLPGRGVLLAVALPESMQVRLFTVNTLGEFRPEAIGFCQGRPDRIRFSDLNGDNLQDIITSTGSSLLVFFRLPSGGLSAGSYFATGSESVSWDVGDIDGDGRGDAALLNGSGELLTVLGNAAGSVPAGRPHVYAVGPSPKGLAAGDFDRNGTTDIAVVNTGSSTLSVLLNHGDGTLRGQVSVPVSANPIALKMTEGGQRSQSTFLISHASTSLVSVVRWADGHVYPTFTIPTGPNPYVIQAGRDEGNGNLSFLTRSGKGGSGPVSLSFFDQIEEDQFVETTLRPNLPGKVVAMTAVDLTGDGIRDIVFATSEGQKNGWGLFVSKATERLAFAAPELLYTDPNAPGVARSIVPAFIDDHPGVDLLVLFRPPAKSLFIACSGKGIPDSLSWIHNLAVPDEDGISVRDLNGDGVQDLCSIDQVSGSVVAFFGKGDGNFGPKVRICDGDDVSAIQTARMKDEKVDLILARKNRGTVEILFDPF
jgi:hypothetical protein